LAYAHPIRLLKECKPITNQIGLIRAIAPSEGVNTDFTNIGPILSRNADFTLEVIGEKGHGLAKISIYYGELIPEEPFDYASTEWQLTGSLKYVINGTSKPREIKLDRSDCQA
jgi:hypothetical protein